MTVSTGPVGTTGATGATGAQGPAGPIKTIFILLYDCSAGNDPLKHTVYTKGSFAQGEAGGL